MRNPKPMEGLKGMGIRQPKRNTALVGGGKGRSWQWKKMKDMEKMLAKKEIALTFAPALKECRLLLVF